MKTEFEAQLLEGARLNKAIADAKTLETVPRAKFSNKE